MTGRFRKRLRRLEGPKPPDKGLEIVFVGKGETREEAKQKHLEKQPDADFSGKVIWLVPAVRPHGWPKRRDQSGCS